MNNLLVSYWIVDMPWWGYIVIIGILVLLVFCIPWAKIDKIRRAKKEGIKYIDQDDDTDEIDVKKPTKVKGPVAYSGLYNDIGHKNAIRLRSLVYVPPLESSCEFCHEFEGKVISLEEYDDKFITMKEAISKGYHHIGCKHIDENYYPDETVLPKPGIKKEQQQKRQIILNQYRIEQNIRDLRYKLENDSSIDRDETKKQIDAEVNKLEEYVKNNNLKRNRNREHYSISEFDKFK